MARSRTRRRAFGTTVQLPSTRWRARYTHEGTLVPAPYTFPSRDAAQRWLTAEQGRVQAGQHREHDTEVSVGDYVLMWLTNTRARVGDGTHNLAAKTVQENEGFARRAIAGSTLARRRLCTLAPGHIEEWFYGLPPATPTQNARAYALLRMILGHAVDNGHLDKQPCRIKGAGRARAVHEVIIPTPAEVGWIADAIAPRYRLMILLAFWCALRKGELCELRVSDFHLAGKGSGRTRKDYPVLSVSRAMVWVTSDGVQTAVVKSPKSQAGERDIALPPFLVAEFRDHLMASGQRGDDLLFPAAGDPSAHLRTSSLYKVYYRARRIAGRPDLHLHDLRHGGVSFYGSVGGATVAEAMKFGGHSTPAMNLHYQHVLDDRPGEIAAALEAAHTAG